MTYDSLRFHNSKELTFLTLFSAKCNVRLAFIPLSRCKDIDSISTLSFHLLYRNLFGALYTV